MYFLLTNFTKTCKNYFRRTQKHMNTITTQFTTNELAEIGRAMERDGFRGSVEEYAAMLLKGKLAVSKEKQTTK